MIKSKNDCTCVLRDRKTGRKLITFSATQAVDPVFSAGFEGGGVASASQSFSVFTENVYNYKPYQHKVEIGDKTYEHKTFFVLSDQSSVGLSQIIQHGGFLGTLGRRIRHGERTNDHKLGRAF